MQYKHRHFLLNFSARANILFFLSSLEEEKTTANGAAFAKPAFTVLVSK